MHAWGARSRDSVQTVLRSRRTRPERRRLRAVRRARAATLVVLPLLTAADVVAIRALG